MFKIKIKYTSNRLKTVSNKQRKNKNRLELDYEILS